MQIIIDNDAFTVDEKITFRVFETKEIEAYTDYTVDTRTSRDEKVETYADATYTLFMISDYFRVKLKDFSTTDEVLLYLNDIRAAYDDDENFVVS